MIVTVPSSLRMVLPSPSVKLVEIPATNSTPAPKDEGKSSSSTPSKLLNPSNGQPTLIHVPLGNSKMVLENKSQSCSTGVPPVKGTCTTLLGFVGGLGSLGSFSGQFSGAVKSSK